jgi:hypothetical protein
MTHAARACLPILNEFLTERKLIAAMTKLKAARVRKNSARRNVLRD